MLDELESLALGAHGARSDANIPLANLTSLLEVASIVRDLSDLATKLDFSSPQAIAERTAQFLALSKRAVALTPTTADDKAIAVAERYVGSPEAANLLDAIIAYQKSLKLAA